MSIMAPEMIDNAVNSQPWWVKTVMIVGFPIIMCGYFAMKDAGLLGSAHLQHASMLDTVATNNRILTQNQILITRVAENGDQALLLQQEQLKIQKEQSDTMKVECAMNATTSADKKLCLKGLK